MDRPKSDMRLKDNDRPRTAKTVYGPWIERRVCLLRSTRENIPLGDVDWGISGFEEKYFPMKLSL